MSKMDPNTDLSQFHQCEDCAAKDQNKKVNDTFNEMYAALRDKSGLSPRQGMMVLSSMVCELASAQANPDAAFDQAISTIKKLFERGESQDERRKPFNPSVN